MNDHCLTILLTAVLSAAASAQTYGFQPRTEIGGRQRAAMVFDSARERVVVAGGLLRSRTDRTIEWDGRAWVRRFPATAAEPALTHVGASAAYDAARRETVAYTNAETWIWDGIRGESRSTTRPTANIDAAMAYDPVRRQTILFGGSTLSAYLNETWEWTGTRWRRLATAVAPPARVRCDLAWDPVGQVLLLQGGIDRNGQATRDTWSWDGTTWTRRQPATTSPSAGWRGMATDYTRNRVVRFVSGETWEWDGSGWTRITTASAPATTRDFSMAYDGASQRVMLAFGRSYSTESWHFDGRDWTRVDIRPSGARTYLAEDPRRGRVLMIDVKFRTPGEPYEWNGTRWIHVPRAQTPFWITSSAWDGTMQRILCFGGTDVANQYLNDTWTWSGTAWNTHRPATRPSPRAAAAMAHHAATGRTVLFGGLNASSVLDETWLWDGTNWQRVRPTSHPTARLAAGCAYDPTRNRVVLAGGRDANSASLTDTWEWDGSTWRSIATASLPPGRLSSMTYDPRTRRIVAITYVNAARRYEFYSYDGARWTFAGDANGQGDRLEYDSKHRQLLVGFAPTKVGRVGGSVAASIQRLGTGCAGALGVPELAARGEPELGNSGFVLETTSGRPRATMAMLLGPTTASLPFGNCTLRVGGHAVLLPGSTNAAGFAQTPLPIPTDPMFLGGPLAAQSVIMDPAGAGSGILSLTSGLLLRVGD